MQRGAEVFCGKSCVAKVFFRHNGETELRILQGMPRTETVEKIKREVPSFFNEFGIPDNIHPKLFAAQSNSSRRN